MSAFRVGIDIGGTFTDLVAVDQTSNELVTAKLPTTPADPTIGFVNVLNRFLERVENGNGPEIVMVVHGTTTATNAVLEGKLPPVALITTKGFRDVLEIGRRLRKDLYNLFIDKPKAIVERRMRFEIDERTGHDGSVLKGIDAAEADEIFQSLARADVSAVAICFLNSYANPGNEIDMKQLLKGKAPDLFLTSSYEICREFREYERASTTVMNAALMPVVSRYIDRLHEAMNKFRGRPNIFIMQSNGGVATVESAKESPVNLLLSGPAGGVIACRYVGKLVGRTNLIGFDMGGTSTDVSVIIDGNPNVSMEGEIAGYPIKRPMIEINTIGAGGGSVAWIDHGGSLRVGPRSAGADPGPICYDKGGKEPTVTDANVILGRIDPDYFLGGEIRLRKEAAEKLTGEMAKSMGMEAVVLAEGIIRIANANMERAIKVSSVEKGLDPRDFTLVAFGGAGALHANTLAEMLDIPAVIVPEVSSEFSALGLLATDIRHDHVITRIVRSDRADIAEMEEIHAGLETKARRQLADEGVDPGNIKVIKTVDIRYVGQAYEINIQHPGAGSGENALQRLVHDFHAAHKRLYAYSAPEKIVELVNFRVTGIGTMNPIGLKKCELTADSSPAPALKRKRFVYFNELGGFHECPIYERGLLLSGHIVKGPAVIEQADSTTLVLAGYQAFIDQYKNLLITRG